MLLAVGRIAQNWISKEAEKKISLSLNDVHVHVHLEENTVQRLVVDCPHPETMYYPQAPLYGKIMDTAINFAVALAGLDMLYVKPDHFTSIGIIREQSRKVDKNWGTLQGQESKVLKMVRMRKFEKNHNTIISFSEIPELITRAFARKLGIPNTETALCNSLIQGQTLCEAILKSYTSASHSIQESIGWPNLKEASQIQEAGGWKSLRKAAKKRMAMSDRGINGRTQFACPECTHIKRDHESFRYTCKAPNCGKEYKSSSGFSKHKKIHNLPRVIGDGVNRKSVRRR